MVSWGPLGPSWGLLFFRLGSLALGTLPPHEGVRGGRGASLNPEESGNLAKPCSAQALSELRAARDGPTGP